MNFNNNLYFIFIFFLVIALIFVNDMKSIEMKMMDSQFSELEALETQLSECLKNRLIKPCEIIKQRIKILKQRKPSIITLFFVWISDALVTSIKSINLYSFAMLIVLIISIKIIVFG